MISRLIAITGGIGAGKSVVSHILRVMGYEVYDTDREAKKLMDNDSSIKQQLCAQISPDAVCADGTIDRRHISSIVFADNEKLAALNAIVHGAVRDDIVRWRTLPRHRDIIFIETAILYQSALDRLVDSVWDVIAPDELRIERVIARNNCSREDVDARIKAQTYIPAVLHADIHTIANDGSTPLLPRILSLLSQSN